MSKIVFGSYDTTSTPTYPWELMAWGFSPPVYKSIFVSVPARSGDIDLSAALNGEVAYENRRFAATLRCTGGTRALRKTQIDTMINTLDGLSMNIYPPDDATHYITGRVRVIRQYNDYRGCSVLVSANCYPWRYNSTETTKEITATGTATEHTLTNSGRKTCIPTFVVAGAGASVTVVQGTYTTTLSAGTYILPDITVISAGSKITVSGSGTLTATYREASL